MANRKGNGQDCTRKQEATVHETGDKFSDDGTLTYFWLSLES